MRKSFLLLFLGILLFSCQQHEKKVFQPKIKKQAKEKTPKIEAIPQAEIDHMKVFLDTHRQYNTEIVIFVNFTIPSKNYRFFIYDMKNDTIIDKTLVSHGSGSEVEHSDKLIFSNIPESYQSSLGKYVIGNHYKGQFGWSYRLKGLDKTNNNAMKRAIVLHPYEKVRSMENGQPTFLSLGCFMLSPEYMEKLTKEYIKPSKKPIIIHAFYE